MKNSKKRAKKKDQRLPIQRLPESKVIVFSLKSKQKKISFYYLKFSLLLRKLCHSLPKGPTWSIFESEIYHFLKLGSKYPIFRFSLILIEKSLNFYLFTAIRWHISFLHKSALFENKNLPRYVMSHCKKKNYQNFKKLCSREGLFSISILKIS